MNPEQIVIAIDSQQLTAWETCKDKFYKSYVRNLEVLRKGEGINKGTCMHHGAEAFYKARLDGKSHAECLEAGLFASQKSAIDLNLKPEDAVLVLKKFASYLKYHSNDAYDPIAVETGFSIVIHETPYYKILYEGRIDLVARMRHNKKIIWCDHKNYLIKSSIDKFTNQFYGYTWAIKKLFGEDGDSTGLLDCTWMAESTEPDKSHSLFLLHYSPEQMARWEQNAIKSLIEIASFYLQPNLVEAGGLHQNMASCHASKFGGCKFIPLCHASTPLREKFLEKTAFKILEEKWRAWQ